MRIRDEYRLNIKLLAPVAVLMFLHQFIKRPPFQSPSRYRELFRHLKQKSGIQKYRVKLKFAESTKCTELRDT